MAAVVAFVSASRPESTWNGAPRLAWPTKLKLPALRVAGAAGCAGVCALAAAVPADQSRTQVKPRLAIRLFVEVFVDVRFIVEAPINCRPATELDSGCRQSSQCIRTRVGIAQDRTNLGKNELM